MKRIYFDYAATTPVAPEVLKAMSPYFSEKFGNPGSLHSFGQEALKAIDESREKIAKAIGAEFREIIFTGSATEANNLALRGVVKSFNSSRAVAFQKQNNFAPAAKFSSPSARQSAIGECQAGAPAGCSSKQSALDQNFLTPQIIISAIEHESILNTCHDLEKEGVEIIYLPVDKNGIVNLEKLKESLNERTILISIMYANNEIGTIQPLFEIIKIIDDFKKQKFQITNSKSQINSNYPITQLPNYYPLLHTDAVQAFQFLNCDVKKLGVDLMTLSAHKIYGPKGIGALYTRNKRLETRDKSLVAGCLSPIITGGGQEFGLRSGTENVPAIVGFAKAIELTAKNREKEMKKIGELAYYFWKEIKKICPKAEINGVSNVKCQMSDVNRLPNILNISFPGQRADDLLIKLDLAGVAVSSGAACSARAMKPSYVLKAIGCDEKKIKRSLRFSFGKFTTKKEIGETMKIIKKI